jgi:hypothetical protein
MAANAGWSVSLACMALLAGCLEESIEPAEPGSLLLTGLLRNVGEGAREGGLGPHCATARVEDDRIVVEQEPQDQERGEPVLWIDFEHDWESDWTAVSTDGFVQSLVAVTFVSPVVDGNLTTVASITWHGLGPVVVDGREVTLPHSWTYHSPDGKWEADLHLEEGPRRVEYRESTVRSCA